MIQAYVALGSNQGEPVENIEQALKRMDSVVGINVKRAASLYLTEPVGYEDQEWFHNTVAEIETTLSPNDLLKVLQDIENQLGRVRSIRWGPRTIDLDIVLYGKDTINEPDLQVPHPRFAERAFVLAPLKDLCPEMVLFSGITIEQALEKLTEKKYVCINKKMW